MQHDQHDLSADSVKLDYQAMLRTALIAVGRSKNACERELSAVQDYQIYYGNKAETQGYDDVKFASAALRLAEYAEQLSVAAATYTTLRGGLSRHEVIIVNKPEIAER